MIIFLSSLAAAIAALGGGYLAFKSRNRLNLALGFTAGVILGLVAFDLLPEIFDISRNTGLDPIWPMIALVSGFLLFHIIEKSILIHHAVENKYGPHQHPHVGVAGAVALSGHSLLDGVSIGLAFQVNTSVGVAVAIAVIGHRFADGFNTTNVMLHHQNKIKTAKRMLFIASVMPILGGLSTLLFTLSESILGIYLGFFAGFLLYIGASDILPQAHSRGSSRLTIGLTVIGTIFIFFVTRFA
ncbi:permease [Candidatus Saccharibacteria bacterium CG10_big_fil_rev_8_21_14_0_10_47_8]|nr:MAG: permease [Candidatus Saccharibacteria bacterium CG10_big_fil_rev_8_21_14_0_10_47_8]